MGLANGRVAGDGVTRTRSSALSQSSLAVLEDALREAVHRGSDKLDCDHLLLALLREPGGRAQRLVMALGKTPRAVERRLNRAREKHAARRAPDAEPALPA
jgi:ATP-dependent Clp protease ATP-binding subunit ClpA